MATRNASEYLPKKLHEACIGSLSKSSTRRITFRPVGEVPTPTEMQLPEDLRRMCRKVIEEQRDDLPIRLYFSSTGRAGRPALPFRDEALALVLKGHRVEAVATFYGVHPQTLGNWGARQPGDTEIPLPTGETYAQLVALGLDWCSDILDLDADDSDAGVVALALHVGMKMDKAKDLAARVGMLVDQLDKP